MRIKFSEITDEELGQIYGFYFYFKFVNPCIIDPSETGILTQDQVDLNVVNNLNKVAKVLQALFGFRRTSKGQEKYNSWIKQKTKDVIVFCNKLIDVKPPEDELQVDRYTELYSKQQPVIIIQLREIVDMHELIKQHIDHIVGNDSESEDPLRTVIKQLGDEIPKISENSTADAQLTLSTRFVNREEQVNDNTQLYDITKELIIRIFRNIPMDQLPTNSLPDILDYVKNYAKNNKNKKLKENAIDALNNVKVLESAGLISSEDNYDSFFKAVSAELSNRELRKEQQQKEIIKLKNALHEIENHHKFVKDRIESLERYLVSCRQNLTKRIKNNKTKREFKYKQLVKDGVIEEVDSDEYEKTKFVISMPEKIGVFQIEAKILSDTIIKLELEDLLEKKDNGEDKLELLLEKNDNGEEKKVVLYVTPTIILMNKYFLK